MINSILNMTFLFYAAGRWKHGSLMEKEQLNPLSTKNHKSLDLLSDQDSKLFDRKKTMKRRKKAKETG